MGTCYNNLKLPKLLKFFMPIVIVRVPILIQVAKLLDFFNRLTRGFHHRDQRLKVNYDYPVKCQKLLFGDKDV